MRPTQHTRKTLLIVCEGTESETSYFHQIRDEVYNRYRASERGGEIHIDISPIPKEELNEISQPRQGARRRTTKSVAVIDDDPVVEEEYKAQPICYVRKAQLVGLQKNTHNEAWAVYDKDEHAAHQNAVDKAEEEINGSRVNIAFSSIAFEQWILLHFEYNTTAFQKSMCRSGRDERDRRTYYFCGISTHAEECKGNKCVCGNIVSKGYLAYVNGKKDFLFANYHGRVNTAIRNAYRLREGYKGNPSPFFELNPYVTIDRLVFRLIHLPIDYIWVRLDQTNTSRNKTAAFKFNSSIVSVEITNVSTATLIIHPREVMLVAVDGTIQSIGARLNLTPGNAEVVNIDLTAINRSRWKYVAFEYQNENRWIFDLSEI